MKNKIVFITGASSGIGEACAEKFASQGCKLIITGRRNNKLNELKNKLIEKYNIEVLTLNFDVRDKDIVFKQIEGLDDKWKNIDILINNAGLAVGLGQIQNGEVDDWERMIDTNIKGLLYVTRAISPIMIENKKGHIINIGSIAGKETYANGNVYCATKHAVNSLTQAMRIDLLLDNIRVSQIAPGAVDTEFSTVRFKGDKERADNVYKSFNPLYANDIADAVYYVAQVPAHVNINDLLIMPTNQANATNFNKKE